MQKVEKCNRWRGAQSRLLVGYQDSMIGYQLKTASQYLLRCNKKVRRYVGNVRLIVANADKCKSLLMQIVADTDKCCRPLSETTVTM